MLEEQARRKASMQINPSAAQFSQLGVPARQNT